MMKKLINLIRGNRKDKGPKKEKGPVSVKKDNKEFLKKEQQVSQIISTRFGRALERLGDR